MGNFHRWTKAETNLLISKYQTIGDKKLAELFNIKYPKKVHKWTRQHIEKKRNYLNLKRTHDQVTKLRIENNRDGRQVKTWDKRGRMQEGEIRNWNGKLFININGQKIPYHRYIMDAKRGDIVRRIDGQFKIITMADNARLNKQRSMEYPPELKEAIKALNQLIKLTNGKENSRPTRNAIRHDRPNKSRKIGRRES